MIGSTHDDLPAAPRDLQAAQAHVLARHGHRLIDTAVVFGSGLDLVAHALMPEPEVVVPYRDLVGMPGVAAVAGHPGELRLGAIGSHRLAFFLGRLHLYQGLDPVDAVYPVRLAAALGAREIVLTNAAGSLATQYPPGRLMLIADQINLTGASPLDPARPLGSESLFVPMTDAYSPRLRTEALWAAEHAGVAVREGVYVGVRGPQYETPAEVAYLRTSGAHAVGMSTVLETIAARALRMKVLGLSLITNAAGTVGTHEDVLHAARAAQADVGALLRTYLHREHLDPASLP